MQKLIETDLLYKLGLDDENKTSLILKSIDNEEIYTLDIGTYNYNIPGTYVKDPEFFAILYR